MAAHDSKRSSDLNKRPHQSSWQMDAVKSSIKFFTSLESFLSTDAGQTHFSDEISISPTFAFTFVGCEVHKWPNILRLARPPAMSYRRAGGWKFLSNLLHLVDLYRRVDCRVERGSKHQRFDGKNITACVERKKAAQMSLFSVSCACKKGAESRRRKILDCDTTVARFFYY